MQTLGGIRQAGRMFFPEVPPHNPPRGLECESAQKKDDYLILKWRSRHTGDFFNSGHVIFYEHDWKKRKERWT